MWRYKFSVYYLRPFSFDEQLIVLGDVIFAKNAELALKKGVDEVDEVMLDH